ncbi:hypothetical protein YC2023_094243 [Brassica napus]
MSTVPEFNNRFVRQDDHTFDTFDTIRDFKQATAIVTGTDGYMSSIEPIHVGSEIQANQIVLRCHVSLVKKIKLLHDSFFFFDAFPMSHQIWVSLAKPSATVLPKPPRNA